MTLLIPIMAGIGALCFSNPPPRRKARRKSRRRNPYGDKRDHRKIDIYVGGDYVGSTTWAKNLKEAVAHYSGKVATTSAEKGPHLATRTGGKVTAHYASRNPGKRRKYLRRGRKGCMRNPKPRDLTEHEFTRGAAHVTVATWRNANATAFVAVTARGPGGVKTWEAKSQGPSSGGYSKPQQALERVFHKMIGSYPMTQGSTLIGEIADIAGAKVGGTPKPGVSSNPRKGAKTKMVYVLQGNYGYGWDDETEEDTWKEMREQLKVYRANGGGTYRSIRRRVPIESNPRRRRSNRRSRR